MERIIYHNQVGFISGMQDWFDNQCNPSHKQTKKEKEHDYFTSRRKIIFKNSTQK